MPHRTLILFAQRLFVLVALGWLPWVAAADEPASAPEPQSAETTEPQQWSDPVEVLDPRQPRSEAEQDRLHAGALIATGRTLFHRGELAGALRHYQRAWRWDRTSDDILGDIVALAFSLERPQEAVRYALLAAEHGESDALMLRRLALYLTEEGDWPHAVKLYRRWLEHPENRLSRNEMDRLLVLLEVGRLEFLNDHPQEASQALATFQTSFLEMDPASDLRKRLRAALGDDLNASWELCAMTHFEAGQYELAAQALAQVELPLDEAGKLGYLQAAVALERGDPVAAWEFLRTYLSPGFIEQGSDPYELLARIFKQLNQPDAYLLELGKLREDDPKNPALAIALASELQRRGETATAVDLLRGVVLSEESSSESLVAEAAMRLAKLYDERSDAAELRDVLFAAADKLRSVSLLDGAIRLVQEKAELVDQLHAVEAQNHSADTAPRAMLMAHLMLAAKELEPAHTYFERANTIDPEQRAQRTLGWGLALFSAEEYDQAVKVFQQAVDDQLGESGDPLFHYYLSMSLELAGRTDEALRVAQTAARMRPDDIEFATQAPWILYHADRRQEAIQQYEAIVTRFDDTRESNVRDRLRDVRSALSNLTLMEGNLDAAEEWLQQILDEFPENIGAMNDLGYLWADANMHLAKAHEMIQTAVQAEPENAAYRDSLGWVLFRRGEFDAARRELERAVELSRREEGPDGEADAIILDHLGDACLQSGDVPQAVKYWQMAVEGLEESEPQKAAATRQKIADHAEGTQDASAPE